MNTYEVKEGKRVYAIETGKIYRDRNSFNNLWGKIADGPDGEDFYLFEPLNGSESYWVASECLSRNAYH